MHVWKAKGFSLGWLDKEGSFILDFRNGFENVFENVIGYIFLNLFLTHMVTRATSDASIATDQSAATGDSRFEVEWVSPCAGPPASSISTLLNYPTDGLR